MRSLRALGFGLVLALLYWGVADSQTPALFELARSLTAGGKWGNPRYTTATRPACGTANLGAKIENTTTGTEQRCNGTSWASSSAGSLTASTMAVETAGEVRQGVSSFTWTNAQVAALAGTAGDINVATLPAKTQVRNAYVVITGQAAGPTTVTVSCGDAIAGTPFINYVVASDAKVAANTMYGDAVAERGTSIDTEFFYVPSYTATTLVTCHFISTGANLSTTTGSTGRVILETVALP